MNERMKQLHVLVLRVVQFINTKCKNTYPAVLVNLVSD